MPQCFRLLDKQTRDVVPVSKVDELICTEVLNVPVHPKKYGGIGEGSFNWYDTIGFMIATGYPLGGYELRNHYMTSPIWTDDVNTIMKIIDYMEERYESEAFYSPKG